MIPCGIPGLKYDSIRYHMVVDANPIVYAESDMMMANFRTVYLAFQ